MTRNIEHLFSVIYKPSLEKPYNTRKLRNFMGTLHHSISEKNFNNEHFLPFIKERDQMNRILEKVRIFKETIASYVCS